MDEREKNRERARRLFSKCKENGYCKQLMEDIIYIGATLEDMDNFIEKVIDLCDKKLNEQDFFTRVMQFAGLED